MYVVRIVFPPKKRAFHKCSVNQYILKTNTFGALVGILKYRIK